MDKVIAVILACIPGATTVQSPGLAMPHGRHTQHLERAAPTLNRLFVVDTVSGINGI